MKVSLALVLAILFLSPVWAHQEGQTSAAHTFSSQEGITQLTDKNIKVALSKFPSLLVYFYASWCGVCKKFAPKYVKLAEEFPTVTFAKLNAETHEISARKYDVTSYPTLVIFHQDKHYTFEGGFDDANEVKSFIQRIVLTPVTQPDDIVAKVKESDKVALLVSNSDSGELYEAFVSASRANQHLPFYMTSPSNPKLAGLLKDQVSKHNIYLFKNQGNQLLPYVGTSNAESISRFFQEHKYDLIVSGQHLGSIDRIFGPKAPPALVGFFENESSPEYKQFEEYAQERYVGLNKGLFFFATSVHEKESNLPEYIGVKSNGVIALLKGKKSFDVERYILKKPVTVENLREFVSDYRAKKIPQYFRSQPNPKDNTGLVKTIVGDTWGDYIPNEDSHSVILMHDPADDDSIKELAKDLSDNPKIRFYTLDWTANDVPNVKIEETPSVVLIKRDDTEAFVHTGSKKKKGILEFLKKKVPRSFPKDDEKTDL